MILRWADVGSKTNNRLPKYPELLAEKYMSSPPFRLRLTWNNGAYLTSLSPLFHEMKGGILTENIIGMNNIEIHDLLFNKTDFSEDCCRDLSVDIKEESYAG
jgi:hypothetical protein